jgi:hypothetical protein
MVLLYAYDCLPVLICFRKRYHGHFAEAIRHRLEQLEFMEDHPIILDRIRNSSRSRGKATACGFTGRATVRHDEAAIHNRHKCISARAIQNG